MKIADLPKLVEETEARAQFAIAKFSKIILDMEFLGIGFSPVRIKVPTLCMEEKNWLEINGAEVVDSHLGDFYRSIALFEQFFTPDWHFFENDELAAEHYRERILRLGRSFRTKPNRFYSPKSPLDGYWPYETQCFIRKIRSGHKEDE